MHDANAEAAVVQIPEVITSGSILGNGVPFDADVTRPYGSTVIFELVYDPALTPLVGSPTSVRVEPGLSAAASVLLKLINGSCGKILPLKRTCW